MNSLANQLLVLRFRKRSIYATSYIKAITGMITYILVRFELL